MRRTLHRQRLACQPGTAVDPHRTHGLKAGRTQVAERRYDPEQQPQPGPRQPPSSPEGLAHSRSSARPSIRQPRPQTRTDHAVMNRAEAGTALHESGADRILFVRGVKRFGEGGGFAAAVFAGVPRQATGPFLRSQGCFASRWRATAWRTSASPVLGPDGGEASNQRVVEHEEPAEIEPPLSKIITS